MLAPGNTSPCHHSLHLFAKRRESQHAGIAQQLSDQALTSLWTYIIERVFQPLETPAALDLIDDNALRSEFFEILENSMFNAEYAIALLRGNLAKRGQLGASEQELLETLISEVSRRAYLESHREILARISAKDDGALVTMATPLLGEIAVPLRRSAKLVTISAIDGLGARPILTANRESAEAIESIQIDKIVTSVDVDIVQYNKENGWGKFRNPHWKGIPSFSVPADRKSDLRVETRSKPEGYCGSEAYG